MFVPIAALRFRRMRKPVPSAVRTRKPDGQKKHALMTWGFRVKTLITRNLLNVSSVEEKSARSRAEFIGFGGSLQSLSWELFFSVIFLVCCAESFTNENAWVISGGASIVNRKSSHSPPA